ncbi:MAG TPA: hypothetical protein VGD30_16320 [Telluria sp.]
MKIAQVFAHAIVRRLAYVLVAAVLAWSGMGKAHAAYCGIPELGEATTAAGPNVTYSTREAAQAACESVPQVVTIQSGWGGGWFDKHNRTKCVLNQSSKSFSFTTKSFEFNNTGDCNTPRAPDGPDNGAAGWHFTGDICPAGSTWDTNTQQCFNSEACKAKPALAGGTFTVGGSGTTCVDGCQFAPAVSICANGICTVGGAKGTGQACGVGDKPPTQPKDQECTPAPGGQTFCVKPDGQHCVSASAGRQICWQPGETGVKSDQDTLQKRDAGTEPIKPNLNLENGDTLTEKGPPVQTNTQVKDGSGTRNITTVVQNYGTTNGSNAGSGNQGQNGDGSGGTGSGPGEGDGEGDEPGQPGDGVGTGLYEGSGKTVSSVMSNFMQQAQQSPLIGAAGQFMGNCTFGGACPNWSYDGGEMMGNVSFDLCNPALASLYGFAGALVMALAAFCAFRIAIY